MAHKFELYKDKKGEYRVRFKYNSEVMFATEGYASKASALKAIESIKKNGPGAAIEDTTTAAADTAKA
ncbi:YegP family protein [Zavarzinia sp. CC-PAN008]|uniref:YegP family protein n=1 Tax=Zavarzinia sp. CC-PAN008 TaxID=3243332 RepID=UPI003F747FC1